MVRGRVQGVYYRASAADHARGLGLGGWVRNLPDGAVEAVAEGEREAIERFVAWCRTGPPLARVKELLATEEPPEGLTGFAVRP